LAATKTSAFGTKYSGFEKNFVQKRFQTNGNLQLKTNVQHEKVPPQGRVVVLTKFATAVAGWKREHRRSLRRFGEHGQRVRLGVEDEAVERDDVVGREDQVQVLERLGQEVALLHVVLGRRLRVHVPDARVAHRGAAVLFDRLQPRIPSTKRLICLFIASYLRDKHAWTLEMFARVFTPRPKS